MRALEELKANQSYDLLKQFFHSFQKRSRHGTDLGGLRQRDLRLQDAHLQQF